jgi:hypothetical protein
LRSWNKCKIIASIFSMLMRWKDWKWRNDYYCPYDIFSELLLFRWEKIKIGIWNEK